MGIRFDKANSFLSKDKKEKGILGFSLPNKKCNRNVCIHSTDLCEKYCYGNSVFRHSNKGKKVLATEIVAQNNYKVSLTNEFIEDVCKELNLINPKRVRIHSTGGDFYSLKYFEKWIEIIKRSGNIYFTAYSKSFDILKEYKDSGQVLPENFNLLLSIYPDTYDTYSDKNGSGQEYVINLIDELQDYFNARKYIVCCREYFIREIKSINTTKCFCNAGTSLLKKYFKIDYEEYKNLFNKDEDCEECLKCYSEEKSHAKAEIYAVLRSSSHLANLNTFLKNNPNKYPILQKQYNNYKNN